MPRLGPGTEGTTVPCDVIIDGFRFRAWYPQLPSSYLDHKDLHLGFPSSVLGPGPQNPRHGDVSPVWIYGV